MQFGLFKKMNINEGVAAFRAGDDAILLDVRTPQEYREGRIPGSQNIPLQSLEEIEYTVGNKETPLFVYCQSGVRSRQATSILQSMGYTNVTNIGGFSAYTGEVER